MTYNRKEHEKWIERLKREPVACCLVLADFEYKKYAFLEGFEGRVE